MVRYLSITFMLLFAADTYACSPAFPWALVENEGMTLEEANVAGSDAVFHGFLKEARTTALSDSDFEGERYYIFHVVEPFKGDISAQQRIEVVQSRGYCSFPLEFDREYLVYLEIGEDGYYRLGNAGTYILDDKTLDLSRPDDKAVYEKLQSIGDAADYAIITTFDDGSPEVLRLSKEKQLDKIRAIARRVR